MITRKKYTISIDIRAYETCKQKKIKISTLINNLLIDYLEKLEDNNDSHK